MVKGIIDSKCFISREVVVVIGDGINDGFVFKKVDVGFVMVSKIYVFFLLKGIDIIRFVFIICVNKVWMVY